MIRLAGLRPRGDQLRLFATGLGIVTFILMWIFLSIKYNIPMPSRGNLGVFVWAVLACLFVGYTLLRFILGRSGTDALTSKALEKLVRIYQRVSGTA
jgi:apolipoprotein N-acyltransferase